MCVLVLCIVIAGACSQSWTIILALLLCKDENMNQMTSSSLHAFLERPVVLNLNVDTVINFSNDV